MEPDDDRTPVLARDGSVIGHVRYYDFIDVAPWSAYLGDGTCEHHETEQAAVDCVRECYRLNDPEIVHWSIDL